MELKEVDGILNARISEHIETTPTANIHVLLHKLAECICNIAIGYHHGTAWSSPSLDDKNDRFVLHFHFTDTDVEKHFDVGLPFVYLMERARVTTVAYWVAMSLDEIASRQGFNLREEARKRGYYR